MLICLRIEGFSKIRGTLFGGPYNKDGTILGSILGSWFPLTLNGPTAAASTKSIP